MKILAIESSAKAASCALSVDGRLVAQYFQNCGLTHSATLLPMINGMLEGCGIGVAELDRIAVAKGPGSFTGLRIGVAAAKGLSWGAEKPVCGVSTLEGMAWQAACLNPLVCCVMDARRAQVYNALFDVAEGRPRRLCEDRAVSLEQLANELKNYEKPFLLVGDGTDLCYDYMDKAGIPILLPPEHLKHQSAAGVAMAAAQAEPISSNELKPEYIRLSQAERELLERQKGGN